MRFAVASLAALLAPAVAFAQPAQPKPEAVASFERDLDALFVKGGLTADAAAARAVKTSPAVARAVASTDAAIASAQAAEISRIPRVAGSATYTRLSPIDPILLGPGASIEFPENAYAVNGQVQVNLSDYVTRYPKLIAGARLGIEAAKASRRASELDAAQEARLAYYEWVRARLQVLVAERQLAQVRATLGQVRALADAQRLSAADRMRVESQEAQAEQAVDQLKNLAALREEQLRLMIDAGSEKLAIGEDIRAELAAPAARELDELLTTASGKRLEFRTLDTGIAAKEKQRDAEKASSYPHLSAFATVDYAKPNQRVFLEPDQFKLTWTAGVSLAWTLNDTLITRANVARYHAEARELRADRANLERGTRVQLLAAQQAVSLAVKALKTSQKGLAAAEESYRVRQALLGAQRATAVELVDAETELTRARITALDARIDLRVALAELAHATGDDVGH